MVQEVEAQCCVLVEFKKSKKLVKHLKNRTAENFVFKLIYWSVQIENKGKACKQNINQTDDGWKYESRQI